MSAKVQIDVSENSQIIIPIAALKNINGNEFVNLYDEHSGKINRNTRQNWKNNPNGCAVLED